MLCGVNEASQWNSLLAGGHVPHSKERLLCIALKKRRWVKGTVQSTEKFSIHEVHKYVNG